ncbi:MAG: hypothetical protein ACR2LG_03545 [Actinomycetota bacterium]
MAKHRSPNYPAVSLPTAIDLVTKLHQKEKRAVVDPVLTVRAWGYTALSGLARSKLSALRKYGLIDDVGQGFRVSDRAMAILYPQSEDERQNSIHAAALAPELFSEMASHVGASDDNLAARLIRAGFTAAGARAAIASYRETMGLVSGEEAQYDAVDEESGVLSGSSPPSSGERAARPGVDVGGLPSLRYGLYDNVVVELKVSGGPLTARQIGLLREYLALQEKAVSVAVVASPSVVIRK